MGWDASVADPADASRCLLDLLGELVRDRRAASADCSACGGPLSPHGTWLIASGLVCRDCTVRLSRVWDRLRLRPVRVVLLLYPLQGAEQAQSRPDAEDA